MSSSCPNCGQENPNDASYCYNCGQEFKKDFLTLRGFVSHALDALVHYDSSLWRTLKDIFIPGKITHAYLNGKRKRYLNPVRFFIILAILYFLISAPAISIFSSSETSTITKRKMQYRIANKNEVIDYLNLDNKQEFPNDSIKRLYEHFTHLGIVDSVDTKDPAFEGWTLDSLNLQLGFLSVRDTGLALNMDYRDVFFLETDSIVQKYGVLEGFESYVAKQAIKVVGSFDSYGEYVISNLSWLFFFLIPLQALFMVPFYWKRSYIAHIIFLLNLHSLAFMILILLSLTLPFLPTSLTFSEIPMVYAITSMVGLALYYYLAAKKVYHNTPLTTILKMIPLFLTYCFAFPLSLLIVFLISMLIF